MKTVVVFLFLLSTSAFAQTYNQIGGTTYGSDGSSYSRIGD